MAPVESNMAATPFAIAHGIPTCGGTMTTTRVLPVPAMSTHKKPNLDALYAAAVDARSSLPNYVERRKQSPRPSK